MWPEEVFSRIYHTTEGVRDAGYILPPTSQNRWLRQVCVYVGGKGGGEGGRNRVDKVEEGEQLHEVVLDGGPADDDRHRHGHPSQLRGYQRPRVLDLVSLSATHCE